MRFVRRPSARQVRAAMQLLKAMAPASSAGRQRDELLREGENNTTKAERPHQGVQHGGSGG